MSPVWDRSAVRRVQLRYWFCSVRFFHWCFRRLLWIFVATVHRGNSVGGAPITCWKTLSLLAPPCRGGRTSCAMVHAQKNQEPSGNHINHEHWCVWAIQKNAPGGGGAQALAIAEISEPCSGSKPKPNTSRVVPEPLPGTTQLTPLLLLLRHGPRCYGFRGGG